MKNLLTVLALSLSFSAFAANQVCTYKYDAKGAAVNWTAFKTPKRVGVKGKLTKFNITASGMPTVNEVLASAHFTVDPSSVDTGDKARDVKIFQFFFKKMMNNKAISGKVQKATDKEVEVLFEMNGKKKTVLLTPKYDEAAGTVTLSGQINVLEFDMKDHLASLTQACFEKHEGVTFPEVEIELVAPMKKSCK